MIGPSRDGCSRYLGGYDIIRAIFCCCVGMKQLVMALLLVALGIYAAWQNRIELLVWAAPRVRAIVDPIPPNVPTNWLRGPVKASQAPEQRPPNIILILADDLGFNDVSLYNGGAGDGSVQTPNIDGIARRGVTFSNGYAANAVCAPSRAAIMTGRYSTRFGFEFTPFFKMGATIFQWMQDIEQPALPAYIDHHRLADLPEIQALGMPPEEVTIAEVLREAGYYTAHIGKWHLGATGGMRPENQGFDDSLYMRGMLYLPENHPEVVNAKREEEGIERMVWANAVYSAQFNGGEPFQTGWLPNRLLHPGGGEGDRGESPSSLLPVSCPLGRSQSAAGAAGGLRCLLSHREPRAARLFGDDPLPGSKCRAGA